MIEDVPFTIVGEVDWHDEPYEFDLTRIIKAEDGSLYVINDSGCSCPSPFEDYNKIEHLGEAHTVMEVEARLKERVEREVKESPDARSRLEFQVTIIMERIT